MSQAGSIKSIDPRFAVPGGEIVVECDGFTVDGEGSHAVLVGGEPCRIIAASKRRVIAVVPDQVEGEEQVRLESDGDHSDASVLTVGRLLADDMHIVANPAIDPSNDSIIVTRSGSRGHQLDRTLFRVEPDGYIDEFPAEVLNPTGVAFGPDGDMFVTNRAEGKVLRFINAAETEDHSTGLGIATGIAFDGDGRLYVGDRSGTIFRISSSGRKDIFAVLEPSVAAYHLAFGPDGRLYVSAPGLSSNDAVFAIDERGITEVFYRGLGRPQGLAFDREGNLYIAACHQGRHGIVRISPDGASAEMFLAAANAVGLCFTREGEMILATNDSVYSAVVGVKGLLLD